MHDHDGLIGAFDLSADRVMMLQNRIEPRWSLRCLCIGGEHGCVLDLKSGRRAWGEAEDDDWLPPAIREQVVSQSLKISGALGYDINAVDLVVGEQGAYVVDASNPAPELDIEVLGERAFRQVVRWLVALVGERARSAERTIDRYRWAREI